MKMIIGFISIIIILQFIGCSKESLKTENSMENSQMVVDSDNNVYIYKNDTLYVWDRKIYSDTTIRFWGYKFSLREFRKVSVNQPSTKIEEEFWNKPSKK